MYSFKYIRSLDYCDVDPSKLLEEEGGDLGQFD